MDNHDLLEILRSLVDEKSGLVSKLLFPELHYDDPDVSHAYAKPSDTGPIFGKHALNSGRAVSICRDRAAIKAICECVERYCAAAYDDYLLNFTTQAELEGNAIGPDAFVLYSDAQYDANIVPFARPSATSRIRWSKAVCLSSREPVWIPAQFVYIPYHPVAGEEIFDSSQSTGLACGATLDDAIAKGLLEVIERDAFMTTWRQKRRGRSINLDGLKNPDAATFVQRLTVRGLRIDAAVLHCEANIPVVMVGMSNPGKEFPHFVCGFGTDLDLDKAVLLALEEACLGQILLRQLAYEAGSADRKPVSEKPSTLVDHALLYATDARSFERVKFIFANDPESSPPAGQHNTIEGVVSSLNQAGFYPVYMDVTTADIRERGLKVVRVLVPGMQPLDTNHQFLHLGGNRLKADEVNWEPHPFP
jgi:ribosomal protein S12 methylthiotransferase accessory factor